METESTRHFLNESLMAACRRSHHSLWAARTRADEAVYPALLSGFRILDLYQPNSRKFRLAAVIHLYGHHVMLAVGDGQGLLETVFVDKVGDPGKPYSAS